MTVLKFNHKPSPKLSLWPIYWINFNVRNKTQFANKY